MHGSAYRAADPPPSFPLLPAINGESDAFDKMFRREVRCLEACRGHPCLVELHAAHHVAAGAFLMMEYTRQSLPEVIRADQHDERSRKA